MPFFSVPQGWDGPPADVWSQSIPDFWAQWVPDLAAPDPVLWSQWVHDPDPDPPPPPPPTPWTSRAPPRAPAKPRPAPPAPRPFSTAASPKRRRAAPDEKAAPPPADAPPTRSALRPPKQAPSVWQIYFTDWLEHQKARAGPAPAPALNVAQAAKEAGQQYNRLSDAQREDLARRALALKERYARECAAWKRTLTPADIARENAFRAAQRRAGKSRRRNLPDPNAPRRPLGAYFLFLQRIRADPALARAVFAGEAETTRQSVLAAAKWRSLSDAEKQPFFEQAENARLEYEAERKAYEDQTRENGRSSAPLVQVYPLSSSGAGDGAGGDILAASRIADY